jgi:hypothetical protein
MDRRARGQPDYHGCALIDVTAKFLENFHPAGRVALDEHGEKGVITVPRIATNLRASSRT